MKLDLKDKKILYALDTDARQSNSRIAKKVSLNKNTVNYKINQMQSNGIIRGYYTIIDSSKLGYFSVRVYLKFRNTETKKEEEVIDWLKKHPFVGVVAKIETVYDLVFLTYVKNIYEWENVWKEFKFKFRKYFWNEHVSIFSKVYHYKRKYLLDNEMTTFRNFETIGGKEIIKYDALDLRILRVLAENARMPLIKISGKLRVAERTIAFRIKQLEKNKIIQGYRVNLALDKIGYEYYKINFLLEDCSIYDRLFSFCKNHLNVIYIDETLDDLDFEIDVEVKNRQELLNLIHEIKGKFDIRDAEILNFKEYLKLETLPQESFNPLALNKKG